MNGARFRNGVCHHMCHHIIIENLIVELSEAEKLHRTMNALKKQMELFSLNYLKESRENSVQLLISEQLLSHT